MTHSGRSVYKGDSFSRLSGKLLVTLAQQFLQPSFFHSPSLIPGPPTSPRFSGSPGPRRGPHSPSHIVGGRCPAVPILHRLAAGCVLAQIISHCSEGSALLDLELISPVGWDHC